MVVFTAWSIYLPLINLFHNNNTRRGLEWQAADGDDTVINSRAPHSPIHLVPYRGLVWTERCAVQIGNRDQQNNIINYTPRTLHDIPSECNRNFVAQYCPANWYVPICLCRVCVGGRPLGWWSGLEGDKRQIDWITDPFEAIKRRGHTLKFLPRNH